MDRIRLLENPIRHYAWGSHTFLARLQGRPSPTSEPEAELWIGAHPAAPSHLETDGGSVALADWIDRDPEAVLGRRVAARFGGELPFLLKILAVEEPLSLQVHPDGSRACAGFEREDRAGIPLAAAERCYRDLRAKPELVCALTPFDALVGLRDASQLRARFQSLDGPPVRGAEPLAKVAANALRDAFAALLALPAAERVDLVAQAVQAAEPRAGSEPASAWLLDLARRWPDDSMALAPYLLHHVRLRPGEAVFVPPCTLHSYLAGAAVEVQAASDNVVRAGLTRKHVDGQEVLAVAEFESRDPAKIAGTGAAEARVYGTPTPEFLLTCHELGADERRAERPAEVEVLLCTEGRATLADPRGGALALGPGEAALVPAAAGHYRVRGPARLFRVRAGEPPAAEGTR